MTDFIIAEKQRIAALSNTEESFRIWYDHYLTLSPREQAVADYLLTAAGKDSYADDYMGLELCPVSCADQKNVNNGYGVLYAIRRDCFPCEDVKLCFLRSDMWTEAEGAISRRVEALEQEIRMYSSGLTQIKTEVIPYSFRGEAPCPYHAITFRLAPFAVKETISMFGEHWATNEIGSHILALTDISGEFDYVLGHLTEDGIVPLWKCSMDFK